MFHFGSAEPLAQSQRSRNVIQTPAVKETAPTDHATARTDVDDIRSKSLYRRHCIDCHDPDGRSVSARDIVSRAPDFTDPQWHRAHGDFELAHTIWEGKKPMPAMKRELAMTDVDGLVLLVRRFRGGKLEISEEPHPKEEKDDAQEAPPPLRSKVLVPPRPAVGPSSSSPGANSISADEAVILRARTTFERLCVGCHGVSGDGSPLRASIPSIPDFTLRAWHEKRSDAAMSVSILEGKGRAMPPFGTRLDATAAHDLVTFLRSLAGPNPDQRMRADNEFGLRFQQLMAEMEALKRDYRALSNNDRFATTDPSRFTGSASFGGSTP